MDKSIRKSNIELLKIIAMVIICFSHVINPIVYSLGLGNDFSLNPINWIFSFIKNSGWLGDFIFITCSCYFLYEYRKISWKKMILYYLSTYFELIFFWIICTICGATITKELTIKTFTSFILTEHWFVLVYIGFLACVPLLNLIVDKLNRKQHFIINIITLVITTILQVLILFGVLPFEADYKFTAFIFLFFIISYGRKYGNYLFMKEHDTKTNLIVAILSIVGWYGFIALFNCIGINSPEMFSSSLNIVYFYSPIFYFLSISLFLLFKDLKVKDSKAINFISSLSLLFYVGHQNEFTKFFADQPLFDFASSHTSGPILGILFVAGLVRFIFGIVVATIAYFVIQKPISILLNRIINSKK